MSNTLEHFFTGKFFRIPNYQRDYSWGIENIDDLIDDIIEKGSTLRLTVAGDSDMFTSCLGH